MSRDVIEADVDWESTCRAPIFDKGFDGGRDGNGCYPFSCGFSGQRQGFLGDLARLKVFIDRSSV